MDMENRYIFLVFKQCPNLTDFFSLVLSQDVDPLDVAKYIDEHRPKVNRLVRNSRYRNLQLIMDVMNTLPTHTVQILICFWFNESSTDLASHLLRHSASLREVYLEQCQEFNNKAIQSILVHCQALEAFSLKSSAAWKIKFDLADAIEFPWASTCLEDLRLLIAMDYIEPTPEGPFYKRLPPINITAAEYSQTVMLEKLYRQISRLVNLDKLVLRLIVCKHPTDIASYTEISFPGMLSLPVKTLIDLDTCISWRASRNSAYCTESSWRAATRPSS
ncbi:hypothetical protein BC939DRAFT_496197 [Gamsiella multidivaricata]|uniref:uncharacterized protein n=1 Tax=Gamsiella multidivaricata TaxID=101098 RepID=UPI00221EC8F6|nr:uncharacterized protein BC939DRAFT_496197 [Gamsiella multidivaricata]KAI7818102.1 hypothetical protein BC939DRAFT_496197 [Gamsiella multidivaricata]